MWNYIFFIMRLLDGEKLHRSSMNGLETRILAMLRGNRAHQEADLSWMDLNLLPQVPW